MKTTIRLVISAFVAACGTAAQAADGPWFFVTEANTCKVAYESLAEMGVRAQSGITPHHVADILARRTGMQSSVTYGGDDAPAMVVLRRPGSGGMADAAYLLIKGEAACLRHVSADAGGRIPRKAEPDSESASERIDDNDPVKVASPSFDCAKAQSVPEKIICSDPELAALDRDLSVVYTRAKREARNPEAFRQQTAAEWRNRERSCRDKKCLLEWYSRRFEQLK